MSFDPVSYAMGRAAAPGGTDVSDTTATAADVLSGKAFHLANGTKTQGSIASKAAQTYTPTTADQTIAAGQYLSGAQTVKGDANLVAGNIKKDVSIFGVTGSYEGGGGGGSISLQSITITTAPTKTSYYDGDSFDPTGMVVTANYNYGMSRVITEYTYSPQTLAIGDTGVTVSFTEDGVTRTATQAVTVEAAPGAGDFATDSWAHIQEVSLAGTTALVYGSQVGTTRQITLTDNTTMTVRLSNATNNMYARSSGSGTTGLVVEFVGTFPNDAVMNTTRTNVGGWNSCEVRTSMMAQLYDLLPSDLKAVIETVDIKTSSGSNTGSTVITSQDKLFLAAEKEISQNPSYSLPAEADALTTWQYYVAHDTSAGRTKYKPNSAASSWWLRTPKNANIINFVLLTNSGYVDYSFSNTSNGISPAFCI